MAYMCNMRSQTLWQTIDSHDIKPYYDILWGSMSGQLLCMLSLQLLHTAVYGRDRDAHAASTTWRRRHECARAHPSRPKRQNLPSGGLYRTNTASHICAELSRSTRARLWSKQPAHMQKGRLPEDMPPKNRQELDVILHSPLEGIQQDQLTLQSGSHKGCK